VLRFVSKKKRKKKKERGGERPPNLPSAGCTDKKGGGGGGSLFQTKKRKGNRALAHSLPRKVYGGREGGGEGSNAGQQKRGGERGKKGKKNRSCVYPVPKGGKKKKKKAHPTLGIEEGTGKEKGGEGRDAGEIHASLDGFRALRKKKKDVFKNRPARGGGEKEENFREPNVSGQCGKKTRKKKGGRTAPLGLRGQEKKGGEGKKKKGERTKPALTNPGGTRWGEKKRKEKKRNNKKKKKKKIAKKSGRGGGGEKKEKRLNL